MKSEHQEMHAEVDSTSSRALRKSFYAEEYLHEYEKPLVQF